MLFCYKSDVILVTTRIYIKNEGGKFDTTNQLKKNREMDQLSIFDPKDPFMGSK